MRRLAVLEGMPARLAASAKLPRLDHLHEQSDIVQIDHLMSFRHDVPVSLT